MYIWILQHQLPHPKKKQRATIREWNTALFVLRAKELGFSVHELEELEIGMVTDIMTEKSNDKHNYPYKASQKDFDRF